MKTFPFLRKQYVLARTRGRKTNFFYGTKFGDLIRERIKIGDTFGYTTLTIADWRVGTRTGDKTYSTEA